MLHSLSFCRHNPVLVAATAIIVLAPLGGCRHEEPQKPVTYTPVAGAIENQEKSQAIAAQANATNPGAARPNDPMNDPELARKGQEILRRTGGDVNKMTEEEKKTFFEAAKNGHL